MSDLSIVVVLVTVLPTTVVVAVVLLLVLRSRSATEQPGWRPSGTPAAHPAGVGRWNAEILGSGALGALGGTLGSTFGTLDLADGVLTFHPEGPPSTPWSLPCRDVVVSKRGLISLNGADVELRWPQGTLLCNVSTEKINRLVDNDLKDLRQRGHADGFLAAMHAHGARVMG